MKQLTVSEKIEENTEIGHVRRCGVCKIDLKGRFVYVDDVAQSLLGYSDEELFGKPLASFVEESQRPILARLIEIRSYYESFHESAALTLVHRDGTKQEATVVFSLNFIAGNPANYQIIIDQRERSESQDITELSFDCSVSAIDMLSCMAGLRSSPDWEAVTKLLVDLSHAELAIVYLIDGKKLRTEAACSPNVTGSDAVSGAPKTKGLHRRVARTGESYNFTDESSVRKAIEEEGTAPNEILVRIESPDSSSYLVRLCFDSDKLYDSPGVEISAAVSLLELLPCLMMSGDKLSTAADAKASTDAVCDRLIDAIENISPGFTAAWVKKSSLRADHS